MRRPADQSRQTVDRHGHRSTAVRSCLSLGKYPNGGVIGVDALRCKHMRPDQKDKRHQRRGRRADPVGQRRDIEIDALAGIGSALAIERKVKTVFGEQDVCEQARPSASSRDAVRRRRRLGNCLAGSA